MSTPTDNTPPTGDGLDAIARDYANILMNRMGYSELLKSTHGSPLIKEIKSVLSKAIEQDRRERDGKMRANSPRVNSWWNSYSCGAITAEDFKEAVRGVELENDVLREQLARQSAALVVAKEALEYYANKKHFHEVKSPFVDSQTHRYMPAGAVVEFGSKATDALAAIARVAQEETT